MIFHHFFCILIRVAVYRDLERLFISKWAIEFLTLADCFNISNLSQDSFMATLSQIAPHKVGAICPASVMLLNVSNWLSLSGKKLFAAKYNWTFSLFRTHLWLLAVTSVVCLKVVREKKDLSCVFLHLHSIDYSTVATRSRKHCWLADSPANNTSLVLEVRHPKPATLYS